MPLEEVRSTNIAVNRTRVAVSGPVHDATFGDVSVGRRRHESGAQAVAGEILDLHARLGVSRSPDFRQPADL